MFLSTVFIKLILVHGLVLAALQLGAQPEKRQQMPNADNSIKKNTDNKKLLAPLANPPQTPLMVFEVDTFYFGTIIQGDSLQFDFVFRNLGKDNLIIKDVRAGCGCTVPHWPKNEIPMNGEGKIAITFHSVGKLGPQHKEIIVSSNSDPALKILHIIGRVSARPSPVLLPPIPPRP
jgi:hypothetical protein